jgi:acyl-CoA synthetase (AMP-forming)/AMP-acid ligase II
MTELVEGFQRSAARRPGATAVSWHSPDGRPIVTSYAELLSHAAAAARGLRALGVQPGDRIADLCDEGLPLVLAILAIGLARGVLVPLDPGAPPLRLRALLSDCEAALAICSGGDVSAPIAHADAPAAAALHNRELGVRLISLDALLTIGGACLSPPSPASMPAMGGACLAAPSSATIEVMGGTCSAAQSSVTAPAPKLEMADEWGAQSVPETGTEGSLPLSHIVYTSGSSGEPKGVACPVRALHSYCVAKAKAQRINSSSRILLASGAPRNSH